MHGLGTIINVAAIAAGGVLGALFGKRLKDRYRETLVMAIGVCTMFLGGAGALTKMLVYEDGALGSQGTMMMVVTYAIGALVGEWIDIDRQFERFGTWLRHRTGNDRDTGFVDAFVTASLTVCIGAMAIVGAIEDGIYGNYSILAAKAVLDLLIILIMTASMGKGCAFSAIPVGIVQGLVTLLAVAMRPIFTDAALANLSLVGNIMIFCVGLNLVFGKKIRVANLLPTLVFAVIWAFVPWLS